MNKSILYKSSKVKLVLININITLFLDLSKDHNLNHFFNKNIYEKCLSFGLLLFLFNKINCTFISINKIRVKPKA